MYEFEEHHKHTTFQMLQPKKLEHHHALVYLIV